MTNQTSPEAQTEETLDLTLDQAKSEGWLPVSFAFEVAENGECAACGEQYEDCPCPGPTMHELYDYAWAGGILVAKLRSEGDRG